MPLVPPVLRPPIPVFAWIATSIVFGLALSLVVFCVHLWVGITDLIHGARPIDTLPLVWPHVAPLLFPIPFLIALAAGLAYRSRVAHVAGIGAFGLTGVPAGMGLLSGEIPLDARAVTGTVAVLLVPIFLVADWGFFWRRESR